MAATPSPGRERFVVPSLTDALEWTHSNPPEALEAVLATFSDHDRECRRQARHAASLVGVVIV
jgi:hypothetical protein